MSDLNLEHLVVRHEGREPRNGLASTSADLNPTWATLQMYDVTLLLLFLST